MSFNQEFESAVEALNAGQISQACILLDSLLGQAENDRQKLLLHDLGNEIQKALFREAGYGPSEASNPQ